MKNKELIPFSKELWETGEYEAVTRNNETAKIYDFIGDKVIGSMYGYGDWWKLDGSYHCSKTQSEHDLMLRKKTKKRWMPTWKNTVNYTTKEECEADNNDDPSFSQAIEVEI